MEMALVSAGMRLQTPPRFILNTIYSSPHLRAHREAGRNHQARVSHRGTGTHDAGLQKDQVHPRHGRLNGSDGRALRSLRYGRAVQLRAPHSQTQGAVRPTQLVFPLPEQSPANRVDIRSQMPSAREVWGAGATKQRSNHALMEWTGRFWPADRF